MEKVLRIAIILLNFSLLHSETIDISITNSFENPISVSFDGVKADIFLNRTTMTATYTNDSFNARVSLTDEYKYLKIDNIDLESLEPLTFYSDKIDLYSNNIYPSLYLNYKDNWIELSIKDEVDLAYNVNFPLNRYLTFSYNFDYAPYNYSIDVMDTYSLNFAPVLINNRAGLNFRLDQFLFSIYSSYKILELESTSDIEDSLSFSLNSRSDFSFGTEVVFKNDLLEVNYRGEATGYSLKAYDFHTYNGSEIYGGNTNDFSIYMLNNELSLKSKKVEITINHSILHFDEMIFYGKSAPFIYGVVAYKMGTVYFPSFNIYKSGLNMALNESTRIGQFKLTLGYNRLYADLEEFTYKYKDLIWLITPKVTYISSLLPEDVGYDHLNIIDLSLDYQIPINKTTKLTTNISQVIPFFDIKNLNSFGKSTNKLSETVTNSSDYIRGGFKFSIAIDFSL